MDGSAWSLFRPVSAGVADRGSALHGNVHRSLAGSSAGTRAVARSRVQRDGRIHDRSCHHDYPGGFTISCPSRARHDVGAGDFGGVRLRSDECDQFHIALGLPLAFVSASTAVAWSIRVLSAGAGRPQWQPAENMRAPCGSLYCP